MLVHRKVTPAFCCRFPFIHPGGERQCGVKFFFFFFFKETTQRQRPGLGPPTFKSEVQSTNHYTTAAFEVILNFCGKQKKLDSNIVYYYTLVSLSQFRLASSMQLILAGSVSVTSYLETIVFIHVEVTSYQMFARKGDVMQACNAPPALLAAAGKKLQDFTFWENKSYKKNAIFSLKWRISSWNVWYNNYWTWFSHDSENYQGLGCNTNR